MTVSAYVVSKDMIDHREMTTSSKQYNVLKLSN